jgi:hypothetical protein
METLVKIQNELKVPKGNLNKFGNYKYRSGEDILEAVKPILLKYEATLILSDEIVSIGNKIFLKAIAKLGLNEKALNKEIINRYCIETNGYAELAEHKGMSAEQATGTASSYARKYALNGLFLIDETEADADSQQTPVIKTPAPLMPSEIIWLTEEQFNAAMKSDKKGILATLSTFNGQKGKKMTGEQLTKLTNQLNLAK